MSDAPLSVTAAKTIPNIQPLPEDQKPNDLFDVLFQTPDGVNHENLSVTVSRFSKHTLHEKVVLVVNVLETMAASCKAFLETYQGQPVTITFLKYNSTGDTVKKDTWNTLCNGSTLPHDSHNTYGILEYEFLFVETQL